MCIVSKLYVIRIKIWTSDCQGQYQTIQIFRLWLLRPFSQYFTRASQPCQRHLTTFSVAQKFKTNATNPLCPCRGLLPVWRQTVREMENDYIFLNIWSASMLVTYPGCRETDKSSSNIAEKRDTNATEKFIDSRELQTSHRACVESVAEFIVIETPQAKSFASFQEFNLHRWNQIDYTSLKTPNTKSSGL